MELANLTSGDKGYPMPLLAALRQRRIALGITQYELADLMTARGAPVTQSSVASWESGYSTARPWMLAAWAEELGVVVSMGLQLADAEAAPAPKE